MESIIFEWMCVLHTIQSLVTIKRIYHRKLFSHILSKIKQQSSLIDQFVRKPKTDKVVIFPIPSTIKFLLHGEMKFKKKNKKKKKIEHEPVTMAVRPVPSIPRVTSSAVEDEENPDSPFRLNGHILPPSLSL